MRRMYDKESGAIIFKHTKDELKQAEVAKKTEDLDKTIKGLCKILNISEEDLKKALLEGDEDNG